MEEKKDAAYFKRLAHQLMFDLSDAEAEDIVKEFDTERGRATEVATGLRQAGVFDAAMQQGINSELRSRRQAMWRWTSDRRSDYQKDNNRQHWDAYLDTSRLSREQSQEAYDRARKQFREYYQQSRP